MWTLPAFNAEVGYHYFYHLAFLNSCANNPCIFYMVHTLKLLPLNTETKQSNAANTLSLLATSCLTIQVRVDTTFKTYATSPSISSQSLHHLFPLPHALLK